MIGISTGITLDRLTQIGRHIKVRKRIGEEERLRGLRDRTEAALQAILIRRDASAGPWMTDT
ncbi:MAG: hypothetical protein ACREOZ_03325 [Gloeomargaritales cyanobacterium]